MQTDEKTARIFQSLEYNGVCVEKELRGHSVTSVDMVFPHVMVLLCLRGTARVMFDMQEYVIEKNHLGIIPPGHFLRRISCSDDYTFSCVLISAKMFEEVKAHTFSHDHERFNYAPICLLTDKYNPQNEMFARFQTKRSIQQNETASQLPRKSLFSSLT